MKGTGTVAVSRATTGPGGGGWGVWGSISPFGSPRDVMAGIAGSL